MLQHHHMRSARIAGGARRASITRRAILPQAVAAADAPVSTKKRLEFPFVKIAGQEDMKLALLLNVVDPNIGGVLVMGDRGTGKSVAVSGLHCCSACCMWRYTCNPHAAWHHLAGPLVSAQQGCRWVAAHPCIAWGVMR
jgi:hypothetical protein